MNLSKCTLLSQINFATLPNTPANATAGSSTVWPGWIDVNGNTLSISGGRGILNAVNGTYPFALQAKVGTPCNNPLIVVTGKFTSSASGGPQNVLYFMSRYASPTSLEYWYIDPYSATQLDINGTIIGESQITVGTVAGTDFQFVYGEQSQTSLATQITRGIYLSSDTQFASPLYSTTSLSSANNQSGGSFGLSGYFNGTFEIATLAVYDQGYGVPTYAPKPRSQRSSLIVPNLVPFPRRPSGTAAYSGGNTLATLRSQHTAIIDLCNPRLQYQALSSHNTSLPNTLAIRASVEYPAGDTPTRAYWRGNDVLALGEGGISPLSDPVPVFIPAGATFWVRTATTIPASGGVVPVTYTTSNNINIDGYIEGSDATASGTFNADYSSRFGPSNIFGDVPAPTPIVLAIGDSILWGQGPNYGSWLTRACQSVGRFGYMNQAMPGEYFSVFGDVSTCAIGYLQPAALATHAIIALGTNDILSGASAAMIQWYAQLAAAYFASFGLPVYLCTIAPCGVSSTDGFTTAANQTVNSTDSVRQSLNTAIRSNYAAWGYSGILDISTALEDPANPGKWLVGSGGAALTVDGTHHTDAGASLAAAAVAEAISQLTVVPGTGLAYSTGGTSGY
jgi:hypothetical protein